MNWRQPKREACIIVRFIVILAEVFSINYFQNLGLRHAVWKILYFNELSAQTPKPREQSQHVIRYLQSTANHNRNKACREKAGLKFMPEEKRHLGDGNLQNYKTKFNLRHMSRKLTKIIKSREIAREQKHAVALILVFFPMLKIHTCPF